jgi:hypothetical protein
MIFVIVVFLLPKRIGLKGVIKLSTIIVSLNLLMTLCFNAFRKKETNSHFSIESVKKEYIELFLLKKPVKNTGFFYLSPCGRGRDQRERVRGVLQF